MAEGTQKDKLILINGDSCVSIRAMMNEQWSFCDGNLPALRGETMLDPIHMSHR